MSKQRKYQNKKLPLWSRSVLCLALRHEPDCDRSSRGRNSKLPAWLLAKDFLVWQKWQWLAYTLRYEDLHFYPIKSISLCFWFTCKCEIFFSVSLVIIPMTSHGSKSQGSGAGSTCCRSFSSSSVFPLLHPTDMHFHKREKKFWVFFNQMKRLRPK